MKQLTREEWIEWRASGITGSEAPAIMGKSPWVTPLDLFKRRMGLIPPLELNYPMRRGLKLEPEAREKYENIHGIEVPARCLTSESWDVARASFDGLNEEAGHAIEIKCPGKEDHITALCGGVPEKYVYQLIHQMFVADLSSIDYVSYNPDSFAPQHQLARVVLMRDEKMERALLIEEKKFWEYLKAKSFPGFTQTPAMPKKNALAGDRIFKVRKSRGLIPPKTTYRPGPNVVSIRRDK